MTPGRPAGTPTMWEAAAAVPAEQLLAWCTDCHRGALGKQRAAARELERLEAPEPAALFDLDL